MIYSSSLFISAPYSLILFRFMVESIPAVMGQDQDSVCTVCLFITDKLPVVLKPVTFLLEYKPLFHHEHALPVV